jgi:rhodanese-related sulfurtransferase
VPKGLVREILFLLCLALVPALGEAVYFRDRISWRQPAKQDEITVSQVRNLTGPVMWLDARPEEEFAADHIPGAKVLNAEHWDNLLPQVLNAWTPDQKVIVYCSKQSCDASHEVARRLREEANLKNVFVLAGGWEAWQESTK